MRRSRSLRVRAVVAPLALGALVLVAWQEAVDRFDVKPYVLPAPRAIATALGDHVDAVWSGALTTAQNAAVGLLIGVVLALVCAGVAAAVSSVAGAAAPLVAAVSVMPVPALAPVLYTMFGTGAQTARVVVAALAAFVPVYVNALRGLRTVAPVHRDLMRAFSASRWQATRTVTLPGALPLVFAGLTIASSLSVISALVAEYFGGPVDGLGKAITSAVSSSQYALAWAYVVGAVVIGLVFFGAAAGLERLVARRSPSSP